MNTDNRPKNLDLMTFSFPVTAITSILHRISGFALFFAVAFLLYALQISLASEQGFAELQGIMSGFFVKLFVWLCVSALAYHFVAGIKHLLMDMGFAEERQSGATASWAVLVISAVLILLAGVWVW